MKAMHGSTVHIDDKVWECFSCALGTRAISSSKKRNTSSSTVVRRNSVSRRNLPPRRTRGSISYAEMEIEDQEEEEEEEEIMYNTVNTTDTTTHLSYCSICGRPDHEGDFYIGCEGKCQRWFHPTCVGLDEMKCRKNPPQGWMCVDCFGSKKRSRKRNELTKDVEDKKRKKLDRRDEYVQSALQIEISSDRTKRTNPETCVQESWMAMKSKTRLCHVCSQDDTLGKIVHCSSCHVVVRF